jgi:hypothetical protein
MALNKVAVMVTGVEIAEAAVWEETVAQGLGGGVVTF